jgi:predicted aspartyl protease
MNKYALILFLFAFAAGSNAGGRKQALKELWSKGYYDPVVTSDSPSCIIPFSRAGNLILVKARADTTEGNFILDTGAEGLVLNLTYFRNYTTNIKDGDPGGITGNAATLQTRVDKLSLGPVSYYKVESDLVNLGHIENNKGIKILGLLGMQLFKQFEMIIDYEKSVIYLHLMSRKERNIYKSDMLQDTAAYTTVPIDIVENKILMYGYMAGKKLRFIIDTGAESNVLDSRLPNKVFDNVIISRRVVLTGSGDKKVDALYGDMKNMIIGNQNYNTLPVLITNLEKMCYSYNACLDGMLGFDFLSLHKIGFNFVMHKMYIWK